MRPISVEGFVVELHKLLYYSNPSVVHGRVEYLPLKYGQSDLSSLLATTLKSDHSVSYCPQRTTT